MLSGELNFSTVPALLAAAPAESLDLSAVTRCDSAGLAALLELRRRAQRQKRSLRLVNAPTQMRELAAFFGVDSILNLE